MMKKTIACLMAVLGLNSACGQQKFENTDVNGFEELTTTPNVLVLDVRTAEEFSEGHIAGAINIDVKQEAFIEKAKAALSRYKGGARNAEDVRIAVYCRSGRRSANAAEMLATEGYKIINLKGGIVAWKEAQKPVTTDTSL